MEDKFLLYFSQKYKQISSVVFHVIDLYSVLLRCVLGSMRTRFLDVELLGILIPTTTVSMRTRFPGVELLGSLGLYNDRVDACSISRCRTDGNLGLDNDRLLLEFL